MTSQNNNDWTPEPFPEPRTIPKGWHAAALENKKPVPEEAPVDDWKPEAFPEPRMFPWDKGR
jgi:hypothetical protein